MMNSNVLRFEAVAYEMMNTHVNGEFASYLYSAMDDGGLTVSRNLIGGLFIHFSDLIKLDNYLEVRSTLLKLANQSVATIVWMDNKTSRDFISNYKSVIHEMISLYAKKNKDYGNSFDVSLDEDGMLVSKIRLGDKFKRFSQLINNEAEVKDESIRDTLVDMANYAIMTVMWVDNVNVVVVK